MNLIKRWLDRALRRWKAHMLRQCQSESLVRAILLYPPMLTWRGTLPVEQQAVVEEAVRQVLSYAGDKWFGG